MFLYALDAVAVSTVWEKHGHTRLLVELLFAHAALDLFKFHFTLISLQPFILIISINRIHKDINEGIQEKRVPDYVYDFNISVRHTTWR